MPRHPHFQAYLALASVCFFWGTTYLGIRIALESMTPPVLMTLRYTISGVILLVVAYFSKAHFPTGRDLWYTALYGVIIIGTGTGCLVYAEQWMPSGLASVFIAGMFVGLAGTTLLVAPEVMQEGFGGPLLRGFLLLQLGCAGWALGSILQRRHQTKAHPVVSGAVQQLATGLAFAVPALFAKPLPSAWSTRSIGAIAYLVVFGSIVGYSAYIFVLGRLPVSVTSIYNYINPIIAVFLGWIFFREHFGPQEVIAMLIIFAGVALVKRYSLPPSPEPVRASAAS